jgi:hypothetical protein
MPEAVVGRPVSPGPPQPPPYTTGNLPTHQFPAAVPPPEDVFSDFGGRPGMTLLTTGPPAKQRSGRRLVRYDLLAGAALLLALLALVPLLLLRGDPEEMSTTPRLPAAEGTADVRVELAEPVDLTDKVRLSWTASRTLDFLVVVAAEGEKTDYVLAERNNSLTVDVVPGRKYCFLVQATDGDDVYESEPVPLRGATCRE